MLLFWKTSCRKVTSKRVFGVFALIALGMSFCGSAWGTQSVTLAWDASADVNVIGYNVYYGPASGSYTNKIPVGNVTNVTINGLVEGATYYFAVTAYDSSGLESVPSNEVSYSVPSGAGNQAPTLNAISDVTINENAAQQTVNLSGISTGATNEVQTLTVTASSSNTGLIPTPTVTYTSPNATGTLTLHAGDQRVWQRDHHGDGERRRGEQQRGDAQFHGDGQPGEPGADVECDQQRDDQRECRTADGQSVGHQLRRDQ